MAHTVTSAGSLMMYVALGFVILSADAGREETISINNSTENVVRQELHDIHSNGNPGSFMIYDTQQTSDQDVLDLSHWNGVSVHNEAAKIADQFRSLANAELGVTIMQSVYDGVTYSKRPVQMYSEPSTYLAEVAQSITSTLGVYTRTLLDNQIYIQSLHKFHLKNAIYESLSCCELNQTDFRQDQLGYGLAVSVTSGSCDLLPASFHLQADDLRFNPGRNLSTRFLENMRTHKGIKWQYFIGVSGVHSEFPAYDLSSEVLRSVRGTESPCLSALHLRHRDVFVRTVSMSAAKNVVIVVDTSMVLSENQLQTAKSLAKNIILSLSPTDQVAMISLSADVDLAPASAVDLGCHLKSLHPASETTKLHLTEYLDRLDKASTLANHSLGFDTALTLLSTVSDGTVMYISRGLMNTLTEAADVLNIIASHNGRRSVAVVINTFGLIDESKPILYEKAFLSDIAAQNFTKYGISYKGKSPVTDAAFSAVNQLFVGSASSDTDNDSADRVAFSQPYRDTFDLGWVISLSSLCRESSLQSANLIGVTGLDVRLEDIFDNILFQRDDDQVKLYVIDNKGMVVAGRELKEAVLSSKRIVFSCLTEYERVDGMETLLQLIINSSYTNSGSGSGMHSIEVRTGDRESVAFTYMYYWQRVAGSPYTLVYRLRVYKGSQNYPSHISSSSADSVAVKDSSEGMVYHRLDLIGQLSSDQTCLHYHQLSSFSTSAFFLSPRAFERPYEHISQSENLINVQNYVTYISDSSSYISKPGIGEQVKDDVRITSSLGDYWRQQWLRSDYSDYIVRRYIATVSGVMRMYPAALTHKLYDPVTTSWYRRASRQPGRIVISRPRVDSAGAGIIVTISHSIYEGKAAALHTPSDHVAAVAAADFSLGYFERLIIDSLPVCSLRPIRCFIIDDRGYLISHPKLISSLSSHYRLTERQHITHVEPVVAHDILGHEWLVSKRECYSHADSTTQRHFQFNTSMSSGKVLTNLKAGDHCLRYQMSLIPSTNTFLVIVNETCDLKLTAFCPCSITDRLCLNCHRMEQTECECPCECPRLPDDDICLSPSPTQPRPPHRTNISSSTVSASCDVYSEDDILYTLPKSMTRRVAQCSAPRCQQYLTYRSCLGIVSCSWCTTDSDTITPLMQPFCDSQRVCFGGVLGARTPYNDQLSVSVRHVSADKAASLRTAAVGPITGAVLAVLLLAGLSVYCYTHNSRSRAHRLDNDHNTAASYEHGGLMPAEDEPTGGGHPAHPHQLGMLRRLEQAAHVSPYHVNENYIPPRPVLTNTTESTDHGYSTMTARDEDSGSVSAVSCHESVVSSTRSKRLSSTPRLNLTLSHQLLVGKRQHQQQQQQREEYELLLPDDTKKSPAAAASLMCQTSAGLSAVPPCSMLISKPIIEQPDQESLLDTAAASTAAHVLSGYQ